MRIDYIATLRCYCCDSEMSNLESSTVSPFDGLCEECFTASLDDEILED